MLELIFRVRLENCAHILRNITNVLIDCVFWPVVGGPEVLGIPCRSGTLNKCRILENETVPSTAVSFCPRVHVLRFSGSDPKNRRVRLRLRAMK